MVIQHVKEYRVPKVLMENPVQLDVKDLKGIQDLKQKEDKQKKQEIKEAEVQKHVQDQKDVPRPPGFKGPKAQPRCQGPKRLLGPYGDKARQGDRVNTGCRGLQGDIRNAGCQGPIDRKGNPELKALNGCSGCTGDGREPGDTADSALG